MLPGEQILVDIRPHWAFLTGPLGELNALWIDYGVSVSAGSGGAMAIHNDLIYVIGPTGRIRSIIPAIPGDTSATASSLATLVVDEVRRVLAQ